MTKNNLPNRNDMMNAIDAMRTALWEVLKETGLMFGVVASGVLVIGSIVYGLIEYTLVTTIVLVVLGLLLWFVAEADSAMTNRIRNEEREGK